GRRIAHGRRLRPRGSLPRVEQRHVVELALTHTREQRLLEVVLALTRDIGLHRGDEILRVLSGQARRSGPPGAPALAVARRTGDDLAARSMLVGPDRVGEIQRVLAGEARPGGNDADGLRAVAAAARSARAPSSRGIADRRRRRAGGGLPRV